jgi:cell pole-organizing protein PopZ
MAEVQEPQVAGGAEPSMEEILASIRKIITDEVPAPAANGEAATQDVIELTQMVQEDGSVVEVKPAAPAEGAPTPPPPPPSPSEPAMTKPPEKAPPAADALVSAPSASAAATSLSALASTVEIERIAHAPATSTPFGNGARTLEDMVIELMRPLLKDWLDKNLPGTVDRLVQKEIERISRKAQD